jgi:hypothetical protein
LADTRRGANIAAVALANKNARVLWALLARDEDYRLAASSFVGIYSGRGWWPRISLHPLRKCCRCAFD